MWDQPQDYKERIQHCWDKEVKGCEMYQVVQKLEAVKNSLKELNRRSFSNIQAETEEAYRQMLKCEAKLRQDPTNSSLHRKEKEATLKYNQKNKAYSQFVQQKAKIAWMKEGDENTTIFHKSLKARRLKIEEVVGYEWWMVEFVGGSERFSVVVYGGEKVVFVVVGDDMMMIDGGEMR
ncbi:hypothetical protein RDABS01_018274 [Bienertia sinuspersici]